MERGTYISNQLRPLPPKVLSEQSQVSVSVSQEQGQVVLEELGQILSGQVVKQLEEEEERLAELSNGRCGWQGSGRKAEELVGSLPSDKVGRGGRQVVSHAVVRVSESVSPERTLNNSRYGVVN